jgi:SHS2 domain-containing protein
MDFIPLSTIEVERSVNLNTLDAESLLVEWLSELAFWAETEMLVFHKFDMEHVSSTQVLSTAYGSRVAQLDKHIKAVTYHNLKISETEVGLSAVVVFDV